jgi:hypothetical protein
MKETLYFLHLSKDKCIALLVFPVETSEKKGVNQ